ncbi:F1F0 ATP synthase subunit e, mitochondrial [Maublancomyces gigas]|uniref:ATP synthase F(0) complex subunit e, mitochondrial n=1 Tax=Discina gigas TaxID=1032678 RepID=A0ABR3GWR9_9PEZI
MVLSSQTVNVFRYTALGVGVLYGFNHQRKLSAQAKIRRAENEYHHKETLITQAKAAWAEKKAPKPSSGGLITDPDDARFNLEALLQHLAADDKKASL